MKRTRRSPKTRPTEPRTRFRRSRRFHQEGGSPGRRKRKGDHGILNLRSLPLANESARLRAGTDFPVTWPSSWTATAAGPAPRAAPASRGTSRADRARRRPGWPGSWHPISDPVRLLRENWPRPALEVRALMALLRSTCTGAARDAGTTDRASSHRQPGATCPDARPARTGEDHGVTADGAPA